MAQRRVSLHFVRHCCPRVALSRHFSSSIPHRTSRGEKPYYITTPIFYPNAGELVLISVQNTFLSLVALNTCGHSLTWFTLSAPHIGHLHSLVVADIFARFARLVEPTRPVLFVAGTDEHGLKIQKAARAKGMHPQAFCDELSEQFRVCFCADILPVMK